MAFFRFDWKRKGFWNVVFSAVTGGAAGTWMLSNRAPQVAERDWRPGFTIDLQQKDVRLALEDADEMEVPLLGTAQVYQMYRTLQRAGQGGEGNHALVKAPRLRLLSAFASHVKWGLNLLLWGRVSRRTPSTHRAARF